MNRNSFLRALVSSLPLFYINKAFSANSQLQIAAIGVGGKGGSDLQQLSRHGKLIAACDVSSKKLNYALKNHPQTAKFSDYREMISHLGGQIDVLSISAPDHIHAHAAQLAIDQGIHLFIQTPLTHTVWEGRQILAGVLNKEICTQIGLQGCASDNFRRAVEFLRTHALGQIEEVHVWTNRPLWPQAPEVDNRPVGSDPIPSGLSWSEFLGPAMERPYLDIYQPYNWRGWRSFGCGALGDVGLHLMNLPVMGLQLDPPLQVECLSRGPHNLETFSAWGIVKFEFLHKKERYTFPLHWYEGRVGHLGKESLGQPNTPPLHLFKGKKPSPSGCIIRGSQGTLYSTSIYGNNWQVFLDKKWMYPDELNLSLASLKRNGRGDAGMKDEFVQSIRAGKPDSSLANISYAATLNEIALLGNISILGGGKFDWDGQNGISNRADINGLLTKPYRNGWGVKKVSDN